MNFIINTFVWINYLINKLVSLKIGKFCCWRTLSLTLPRTTLYGVIPGRWCRLGSKSFRKLDLPIWDSANNFLCARSWLELDLGIFDDPAKDDWLVGLGKEPSVEILVSPNFVKESWDELRNDRTGELLPFCNEQIMLVKDLNLSDLSFSNLLNQNNTINRVVYHPVMLGINQKQ